MTLFSVTLKREIEDELLMQILLVLRQMTRLVFLPPHQAPVEVVKMVLNEIINFLINSRLFKKSVKIYGKYPAAVTKEFP